MSLPLQSGAAYGLSPEARFFGSASGGGAPYGNSPGGAEQFSFGKRIVQDYLKSKSDPSNGTLNYHELPPELTYFGRGMGNELVSLNGTYDPANEEAIFNAIRQSDPSGFAQVVKKVPDGFGAGPMNATGTNYGDTINYTKSPDNNDWLAPVMALAGPFLGPYMQGGWGGAASGAAAMGGGAFGLGNTALGLGGAAGGLGAGAGSLGGLTSAQNEALSKVYIDGNPASNVWNQGGAQNSFDTGAMQNVLNGGADAAWGVNPQLSQQQLLDKFAAENGGNMGFNGDVGAAVPGGAGTGITVPSWFGTAAASGVGGGVASGIGGALSRMMSGEATSADYLSLAGMAGGAALGSMNGSKPAGTTTTVTDIPDWLKPAAMKLIGQGDQMVSQNMVNPAAFTQSDNTLNGIMGGSIANPHLGDNNPYFEQMLTKSLNDTQGRVNNQFGNRSAFGGSANQELLQRGLGDQANALRFGEHDKQTALYENDINRRTTVATQMPAYSNAKTTASFAPLTAQKGLLNFGGSQTSQPYFNNPTGGALYGGLLGSQLFGGTNKP